MLEESAILAPVKGSRGVAAGVQVSFLSGDMLAAIAADEWDTLSREALIENPFYSRNYVLAGCQTIDEPTKLKVLVIRDGRGKLIGLLPLVTRWGLAYSARNKYQFSGTPLLHRDHARTAVAAWLGAIAAGKAPPACSLRDVALEGPLVELLRQMCGPLELVLQRSRRYGRPLLEKHPSGFERHLDLVVPKSRRKELERTIRRLREQGALSFEHASEPDQVSLRVEQFLTLERVGWKGKAGTAFLCSPQTAAFARAAFRTEHGNAFASTDALLLDGKPIAISVNIATGRTVFTPKCTYDESLRKWGPGMVLEYMIVEDFYASKAADLMDSAATVDGHVVQGLWSYTADHGELVFGKALAVQTACLLSAARAKLKHTAKTLLLHTRHVSETLPRAASIKLAGASSRTSRRVECQP